MALFDYTNLVDTVVNPLVTEFGVTTPGVLLTPGVPTGSSFDPQPAADTRVSVNLVRTSFTHKDMSGGNVQVNDIKFLASTEGVTVDPGLSDRLEIEGEVYQVVSITPLKPGSTLLLWFVHVRK